MPNARPRPLHNDPSDLPRSSEPRSLPSPSHPIPFTHLANKAKTNPSLPLSSIERSNADYAYNKDASGCLLARGILLRPLLGRGDGGILVLLPALGHVVGERVVRVGGAEEGLDGEEDCADLEGGGPVSF